MRRVLRVLVGFVVACFAAALTTLLFVYTPEEVLTWTTSLPAEDRNERFSVFGLLWLAAATQSAVFSALFALLAVVIAEWRKVRAWTYYAIAGIVIALLGFAAQWLSEPSGQNWSVVNSHYPFVAFLTTGFVGGFTYWMVAGRHAGGVSKAAAVPTAGSTKPALAETKEMPKAANDTQAPAKPEAEAASKT